MGVNKEVVKKDHNGNILKLYKSCKDAAGEVGIELYALSRKIKKHQMIDGFYYEYTGADSKIIPDNSNKIKCPYCSFYANNYNGLCKHIFKNNAHPGITREQLLTDVKYGGVRPTCKCGCGGYTTILYADGAHFAEYIQGHWNYINNNWGHNPKAIENSAKTRREQYQSGKRIQWNKGKKWDEIYEEETQKRLRDNLIDKLHKRIDNSHFSISSNLELKFIEKFIKPYTEKYKTQYYLHDIKQFCDIFIPDLNLVIEINGSYWHCDRRIYNYGPINDIQKEKIQKDEIKYTFLYKNGYNLIIVWEYDIINHADKIEKLFQRVFSKNNWKEELNNFIAQHKNDKNIHIIPLDLTIGCSGEIKKKENTIYIFEDEWLFKKEIVKSRLLNKLGEISNKIYARKCYIKEITYQESSSFLEENHLQGKIAGCKYLGLFYENQLVSLMVFGKLRKNMGNKNKEGEYELLRFCSLLNTNVIGAAGKLFNFFLKTYKPKRIISYCDKRWGDGEFYEKIGMVYTHDTQINYYYVNDIECRRENRFSYRKDVLIRMGFNRDKSEKQIMIERGIRRVFDCGCKVFAWENNIYKKI